MTNNIESFHVLIDHLYVIWKKMSIQFIFSWIVSLFLVKVFLYIRYKILIRDMICKCFLPFHWLSYYFHDGFIGSTKVFNLMKFQLSGFFLLYLVFLVFSFLILYSFNYMYTIQRGLKLIQGSGTTSSKGIQHTLDFGWT